MQPQLAERFAFDPAHNIVDPGNPGGRMEGNRVTVYEDKRFRYDGHGNVIEKLVGSHTRMQFDWNAAHQLVKSRVQRGKDAPAQTVKYVYDPFGRRIAKRDGFGTPRELTDDDGSVTWAATYRAWGNVLKADEWETAAAKDGLAQAQPIRFQGQYHDSETGLHYNRFRYYDTDVGRFVSQDPVGLTGGFNNYQYAPNAVSWSDPSGLSGRPIVVIGEGQRAVNEAARQLKSSGYAAESMTYPAVQWPKDLRLKPGMDPADFQAAVQWNKEWLMDKIAQGYQVVDIGPDGRAGRPQRSERVLRG